MFTPSINKALEALNRDDLEEALKHWIALGILLDHRLGGQLSRATAGGLGALRRAFRAKRRGRTRRAN